MPFCTCCWQNMFRDETNCSKCGVPLSVTYCRKCSSEIHVGNRFCGKCGTSVKEMVNNDLNALSSPRALQSKFGPTDDILEVIRLYYESIQDPNTVDKEEQNRRCNEMLTEYDWYTSHFDFDFCSGNRTALWQAVCQDDTYYNGSRYECRSMSDLFLMIQEKNNRRMQP